MTCGQMAALSHSLAMNAFQRLAGILIGILAVTASSEAAGKWIHARTEHFDMYSAVSEKQSRRFLNELEQFRSAFQQLFRLSPVGGPPVTVMMFESSDQMEPYLPVVKGKTKRVAGLYRPGPDEDFIMLSAEAQDRGGYDDNVIFHEYVHKLLREQGFKPPVWLNEGLAVFYATMRVDEDSVEIGQPAQRRLERISRAALMPLEQLFAVTHSSPEYNEAQQSSVFYAQSWLLVHYLTCGTDKQVQGKFPQFLEAVNDSPQGLEERFRQVYGMSYSQMEISLRSYMSGGRFAVRTCKIPVGNFTDKIHFEPVGEIERDVALENLRWRGRTDDGVAFRLLALAERDPKAAKPYEALASFSLNKGRDRRQAETYWELAVERGSTNAYVYLQLAKVQLRGIMANPSLDNRIPPAICDSLRKNLDRAVELRPNYMEAWDAMAQVEAFSEKPRASVVNQFKSILPLMRSKANTLASLAIIAWRQGDAETCRSIMDMVEKSKPGPTAKNMIRLLNKKLGQVEEKQPASEPEEEALKPIDRP
jgi:Protein of unknown function (DUF1570)